MSRPDPIEYAEHLYAAIRGANFSTLSFLAFGNAVKDGVELRRMPRIAAEPFMRVVGEMLDLEEDAANDDIIETVVADAAPVVLPASPGSAVPQEESMTTAITEGGPTDDLPDGATSEPRR